MMKGKGKKKKKEKKRGEKGEKDRENFPPNLHSTFLGEKISFWKGGGI